MNLTNPFTEKIIGSLIRTVLGAIAGSLVTQGYLTAEQAADYTVTFTGAVLGLVTIGWSIYEKRNSQRRLLVAMTMPKGTNQAQVEAKVKERAAENDTPPVTLAKTVAPY